MKARLIKKRVRREFRNVLRRVVPVCALQGVPDPRWVIERYWKIPGHAPVIIVDDNIINRQQLGTQRAATPDGVTFYVRRRIATRTPSWVLQAILAHEVAHALAVALRFALPTNQVENDAWEVFAQDMATAWGFPDAHDWVVQNGL